MTDQLTPHRPELYIAGAYISKYQVWLGEFDATASELYEYALNNVETVEEYDTVMTMVIAQQVYMMWWDKLINDVHRD